MTVIDIIRKLLKSEVHEELHLRRKDYKMEYKSWSCTKCNHSFLYKVHRCPLCESARILESSLPTRYAVMISRG